MKLSMKRACNLCRANNRGSERLCQLGYAREAKILLGATFYFKPIEPCPKPISHDEMVEAVQQFKKVVIE